MSNGQQSGSRSVFPAVLQISILLIIAAMVAALDLAAQIGMHDQRTQVTEARP